MKKLSIILNLIFVLQTSLLFSQTEEVKEEYQNFWANGKEVGINVSNLASRFVPFNLSGKNDASQFIALKTKWYGQTRAFILNFGANLGDNESNTNKFYFGLGYEKRRNISEAWKYVTGWELIATNFSSQPNGDPYIGISKAYGIEYHFADNFYLSTEARLILGSDGDDPKIILAYPTSIFFNMLLE